MNGVVPLTYFAEYIIDKQKLCQINAKQSQNLRHSVINPQNYYFDQFQIRKVLKTATSSTKVDRNLASGAIWELWFTCSDLTKWLRYKKILLLRWIQKKLISEWAVCIGIPASNAFFDFIPSYFKIIYIVYRCY